MGEDKVEDAILSAKPGLAVGIAVSRSQSSTLVPIEACANIGEPVMYDQQKASCSSSSMSIVMFPLRMLKGEMKKYRPALSNTLWHLRCVSRQPRRSNTSRGYKPPKVCQKERKLNQRSLARRNVAFCLNSYRLNAHPQRSSQHNPSTHRRTIALRSCPSKQRGETLPCTQWTRTLL